MKLKSINVNITDRIRLQSGNHVADCDDEVDTVSVYNQIRFNGRRAVTSEVRDQIRNWIFSTIKD
jgi:hypothetical protein